MSLSTLAATFAFAAQEIVCPGSYGGHVQGIATDDDRNIYWSFTVALVKTDREGKLLAEAEAPSHQGDVVWVDGKLYCAVNLGAFNQPAGKADSWVYVYDDESLELLSKHKVQEVVHGAGGMTYHDGIFTVIGGLPGHHTKNYAYLYSMEFQPLEKRNIESGHSYLGIQTACYLDGRYWFGTYDKEDSLLVTDGQHAFQKRLDLNGSYGIAPWTEGHWLRATSIKGEEKGAWGATALVEPIPE